MGNKASRGAGRAAFRREVPRRDELRTRKRQPTRPTEPSRLSEHQNNEHEHEHDERKELTSSDHKAGTDGHLPLNGRLVFAVADAENCFIELTHGDITQLTGCDAIVNASNVTGLGCDSGDPKHCIDSAIHHAAGPELREECKTLGGVPTGIAKMTRGYNLPAKYVIHVTGPQLSKDGLDFALLSQCYRQCLALCSENKFGEELTSVAFCGISTGLFGFPAEPSATVALTTCLRECRRGAFRGLIVFTAFTPADAEIYQRLLAKAQKSGELIPYTEHDVDTAIAS